MLRRPQTGRRQTVEPQGPLQQALLHPAERGDADGQAHEAQDGDHVWISVDHAGKRCGEGHPAVSRMPMPRLKTNIELAKPGATRGFCTMAERVPRVAKDVEGIRDHQRHGQQPEVARRDQPCQDDVDA